MLKQKEKKRFDELTMGEKERVELWRTRDELTATKTERT